MISLFSLFCCTTCQHAFAHRYLPWADEDVHEEFANGMFTDPRGHLKLSASQIKAPFKRWQRAAELTERCTMIEKITPQSIRQTVRAPLLHVFCKSSLDIR